MGRRTAAAAWAIGGFVAVIAAFFYFAWTMSIVSPVDWPLVLSVSLFFAPVGLFAGFIGWERSA